MLLSKQKKNNQDANVRRLLISINVLGCAAPIQFVVNEEDLVAAVVNIALESYTHKWRLPVLGTDTVGFALYCLLVGSDGISSKF